MLPEVYKTTSEPEMTRLITEIKDTCYDSDNKHLRWFDRLMDRHFERIIAFATYYISNGQIEGVNNKIRRLRRQRIWLSRWWISLHEAIWYQSEDFSKKATIPHSLWLCRKTIKHFYKSDFYQKLLNQCLYDHKDTGFFLILLNYAS